ncbi:hypothetical protein [Embleya sp. NPDC059259]|uniref:hypothetical protein n=1 Tax=unclassified Embleya TaxID=2699296 RepID=UPI00368A6F6B
MNLSEQLAEWQDIETAMLRLGRTLGLFEPDDTYLGHKWVFWSRNPLGDMLYGTLEQLVEMGALERRENPNDDGDDQFRWCPEGVARLKK